MNFFFLWTGSYGLAIIILTVVIRVILFPFTITQMRTMRKMQELQPELKKLQEKYKKDPQRLNKETMELWRRERASPLSGCLPMLLQLPFLFALFNVLQGFDYAAQPGFLWLLDLSKADTSYMLPVLAAVTTWWQNKIMTPSTGQGDATQRVMGIAMPLMIGWMALRFAAGLSLYWVVSNLLGILQQYLTVRPVRRRAKGEAE
jgi:YidC/Oxa1 family membrane protein insertase